MDIWPQNVVQTKESEVEVAGSGGASQSRGEVNCIEAEIFPAVL